MDLSVIIPHYNNLLGLNSLINQLLLQLGDLNKIQFEIIIIDNGTQADYIISANNTNVVLLVLPDPKNPYLCRNAGINVATGSWLLFLDTNITLSTEYLTNVFTRSVLDENRIYSAPILHKETGLTITQWIEMLGLYQYNSLLKKGEMTLIGNLLIHKKTFQRVGLFGKERNGEEIKWLTKAKLHGYSISLLEGICVYYRPKKKDRYLHKKARCGIMDRKELIEKGYPTIRRYLVLLIQMRPPNPIWIYRLLREENLHNQELIWYVKIYFTMWYYRIYQKMIALEWIQGTSD